MTSILKVDTIQDADGNNIINESSNTITIGASGDTTNIVGTLQNNGSSVGGDNTPYFFGRLASDTVITRNSMTKVTSMTNSEIDTDSAFDGTTFTVPSGKGGKYFIQGTVTGDYADIGQDGEETVASIYKNGSSIQLATWRNSSTVTGTGRVITTVASTIQDLSASDTIELYALIMDASGSNGKVKGEMTTLLGYKLIG